MICFYSWDYFHVNILILSIVYNLNIAYATIFFHSDYFISLNSGRVSISLIFHILIVNYPIYQYSVTFYTHRYHKLWVSLYARKAVVIDITIIEIDG